MFFNLLILYSDADESLIAFRKGKINEEAYTITV